MYLVKGIIHRDLKGNNIFCCGGGILKLGDFGISKVLTPSAKAARTMIGTPYYMLATSTPGLLMIHSHAER